MNWMSRCFAHIRRFINEHCVNRFDVWSTETLQIFQNFRVLAEFEKYFILLPVLNFCYGLFTPLFASTFLYQRNIPNDLHTVFSFQLSISIFSKSRSPLLYLICCEHSSNNKKSIFFVKLSLLISQCTTINGILEFWHLLLELLKSLTHFYNESFFKIIIRS